jgi:hypothetical protein
MRLGCTVDSNSVMHLAALSERWQPLSVWCMNMHFLPSTTRMRYMQR